MKCISRFGFVSVAALITVAGSLAFAQNTKDKKPGTPPSGTAGQQPPLPPGWTSADMQACMAAGTPGPMHDYLSQSAGTWSGKTTMWMAPGVEPTKSDCTSTISTIMDGRFTKCELAGDMGMGPFNGLGLYGYDNVTQKFQANWIDNCATTMMNGTGERSSDGKTMTWKYNYTCPVTKKPTTMREVEHITGKDGKTMEMYGVDPKSGKEFKMMEVVFTRTSPAGRTAGASDDNN